MYYVQCKLLLLSIFSTGYPILPSVLTIWCLPKPPEHDRIGVLDSASEQGSRNNFLNPEPEFPWWCTCHPPTSMKTEDKVWFHGIARISEEMIEMCVPRQLHSKELWSGFARWGNCAAMKKEKCQVNAPLLFIFFSLWSVSVLYFLQIGKIFMIFI